MNYLWVHHLSYIATYKFRLTLGVTFGLAAGVVLLSLILLGVCMLVPLCPMRRLYSQETAPVGHDPTNVVMSVDQESGTEGGGGETT